MSKFRHVGFTGTRSGMTDAQKRVVRDWLDLIQPELFTHGDCLGADADAHGIASSLSIPISIRPCNFPNMRAHCQGARFSYPVTTAFARNRAIVQSSEVLLATPWSHDEQPRGGTWYTIRYARKIGVRITIVNPDGTARDEVPS